MSEIDQQQGERDTIRARNRHEKGTKRAWFGHGFARPQHAQPPLPSALAPPQKTFFSATSPTCQTNPPRALRAILDPPSSPPRLYPWPTRP